MIPDDDLEERLRRIMDDGSASAQPAELAELRAQLAQEPDTSGDFPKGTQVAFGDDLEVAVPTRRVITPRAAAPVPAEKVVQVPSGPEKDPDRVAAAYARAQDREARSKMAMERGGRELVAGLTRTAVQPVTARPTDAFEKYVQAQRQQKSDGLREKEANNNAARTKAYLDTTAAAGPRAERGLDIKEKELTLREDLAEKKAGETQAEFDERKRHNRATEGIGWTSAKRADEKADRDETRLSLKTDALRPRAGWEPIEEGAPTFRDAGQAKSFDNSEAAMGAIRNHRDHVLHELETLKKATDPKEIQNAVGRLNAQMGALASKLRDAEGLNNTDAANHAIETMLALDNGSAVTWKNVLNQGRLPSILNAAIDSGEANLDTVAKSNNLRRSRGGKQPGPGEGTQPARKTLTDGRVVEKHADGLWYPVAG